MRLFTPEYKRWRAFLKKRLLTEADHSYTTLHFVGYGHDMGTAISHKTRILRKIFVDKKDLVQVARETDHSPDAVGKHCQEFNKVKWCVENGMGEEEMRIVTGMKAHLIAEYLKNWVG